MVWANFQSSMFGNVCSGSLYADKICKGLSAGLGCSLSHVTGCKQTKSPYSPRTMRNWLSNSGISAAKTRAKITCKLKTQVRNESNSEAILRKTPPNVKVSFHTSVPNLFRFFSHLYISSVGSFFNQYGGS